jgi:hypothetical protein
VGTLRAAGKAVSTPLSAARDGYAPARRWLLVPRDRIAPEVKSSRQPHDTGDEVLERLAVVAAIISTSFAGSMGFTRWRSNPASSARRQSSGTHSP